MRREFDDATDRIHGLSAGFREVADELEAENNVEADAVQDQTSGLADADIEAYAAEAQDDANVYVRDRDAPATAWLSVNEEIAVDLCTGTEATCSAADCPKTTAEGGQR